MTHRLTETSLQNVTLSDIHVRCLHNTAIIRVREGFEIWKRAFDNMSWERYLDSILELWEDWQLFNRDSKALVKKIIAVQ